MALVLTASFVTSGDPLWAKHHRNLIRATDEVLQARYNNKTWLCYNSNTLPGVALGERFQFGTPVNLNKIALVPYDFLYETEPNTSYGTGWGQYIKHEPGSKVLYMTATYNAYTLNRKKVTWTPNPSTEAPSTWWLGIGGYPERFEALKVADVAVENYIDHVAANTGEFTWKSNWDKHGCIRIHNGNRFALIVNFQAHGTSVIIPPYGIYTARRSGPDDPFVSTTMYLHPTQTNDFATYNANKIYEGQYAGNMETIYGLLDTLRDSGVIRCKGSSDYDTTSLEKESFTGNSPVASDKVSDWLIHRGAFTHLLVDNNTGAVATAGENHTKIENKSNTYYNVSANNSTIGFSSNITEFNGTSNFRHYIVPIGTNLTNGAILDITDSATLSYPATYYSPLNINFGFNTMAKSTGLYATPWKNISTQYSATTNTYSVYSPSTVRTANYTYTETIDECFGIPAQISQWYTSGDTIGKAGAAIYRKYTLGANVSLPAATSFNFDPTIGLVDPSTDGCNWVFVDALINKLVTGPRRFVAKSTRKYHILPSNYTYSPAESYITGSPKPGGLDKITLEAPIYESPISIEGSQFSDEETYGLKVHPPTDILHTVATKMNTRGWFKNNYDRLTTSGLNESEKLISWRLPRCIEHLNNLALFVNNIYEVIPTDIRDLHYKPLLREYNQLPFRADSGHDCWAVPSDYLAGYDDRYVPGQGPGPLVRWCNHWGITAATTLPDLDDLRSYPRKVMALYFNGATTTIASHEIRNYDSKVDPLYNTPVSSENVGGYQYLRKYSLSAIKQRRLFGAAGAQGSFYRWVKRSDAKIVFDNIGIPLPPQPLGMNYDPVIERANSVAIISGAESGTPNAEIGDWLDIDNTYKSCNELGTWRRIIKDGETFRICDKQGSSKRRYYHTYTSNGTPTWLVYEFDDNSTDNLWSMQGKNFNQGYSNYYDDFAGITPQELVPLNEAQTQELWPSVKEIHCDYGCYLLVSKQAEYNHSYTSPIPSPLVTSYDWPEKYTKSGPSSDAFFLKLDAADMPITCEKIRSWINRDTNTYHCQIWPIRGVTR